MVVTKYETDFYGWTQEQSAKLRALLVERSNLDLDLENIAEEIDSMGRSDRREVHSRLARIIEHLLKLENSTLAEPRRQWQNSIRAERDSLRRHFKESPSLFAARGEELADAYDHAVRRLKPNLIELCMDAPPASCPYDLDDQILDAEWFPHPRDG
ncbi:MAG: DUF29 domain-containing protein [Novosphingobium sp.]